MVSALRQLLCILTLTRYPDIYLVILYQDIESISSLMAIPSLPNTKVMANGGGISQSGDITNNLYLLLVLGHLF